MRSVSVSCALTVFHDGRFWVGVVERVDDGHLSVCRIVFGAEPSDEEIYELVCGRRWDALPFTEGVAVAGSATLAGNPKRRQREVRRMVEHAGRWQGTKAQQALAQEHEQRADKRVRERAQRRREDARERFAQHQEKRKRKHRGH